MATGGRTTNQHAPVALAGLPRPMPELPLARYRLEFIAAEEIRLPAYTGSAWRGAFGHALKRTVCVTRQRSCQDCLLYRSCVYPYLFDTPPPPDARKMRRYTAAPHPFVVQPATDQERIVPEGTRLVLGLTLFGRANTHLAYFIHTFMRVGEEGIGSRRGRLELGAVAQESTPGSGVWQPIYQPEQTLEALPAACPAVPECAGRTQIQLETPLRLRRDDHYVTPEAFRFGDLFTSLLRRISMLTYFHTGTPLETDFKGLVQEARAVPLAEAELTWHDWTRYSSRQETTMQMGGLAGTAVVDLTGHRDLWPYLWLGQWTHAGKGTSMGLGRYTLPMPPSLPEGTHRSL